VTAGVLQESSIGWLRLAGSLNDRSLLQNIVSFIGLLCLISLILGNRYGPSVSARGRQGSLAGSLNKNYRSLLQNMVSFSRALLQQRPLTLAGLHEGVKGYAPAIHVCLLITGVRSGAERCSATSPRAFGLRLLARDGHDLNFDSFSRVDFSHFFK